MKNSTTIVIPAYKPCQRMSDLVNSLKEQKHSDIVIVDDGSGPSYEAIFDSAQAAGAEIIRHAVNCGKGRALKTGINHVLATRSSCRGIVTADADGQHLPEDILAVSVTLLETPTALILGSRCFDSSTPLRSRIGNTVTRRIFRLLTGRNLVDTQTGLRGIPRALAEQIITLEGERYEYELNMLQAALRGGFPIIEHPISTVYIEENASSHFDPLVDSWRVYRRLLGLLRLPVTLSVVDILLFAILSNPDKILISLLVARLIASLAIFPLHRVPTGIRLYKGMAVGLLSTSFAFPLVSLLAVPLGDVVSAKVLTEAILILPNHLLHRKFITE